MTLAQGAAALKSRVEAVASGPVTDVEQSIQQTRRDIVNVNRVLEDIIGAAQADVKKADESQT